MSLLLILFACCTGSLMAALVGLICARRKIGFGWTFFLSLVFTPFIEREEIMVAIGKW